MSGIGRGGRLTRCANTIRRRAWLETRTREAGGPGGGALGRLGAEYLVQHASTWQSGHSCLSTWAGN